MHEVVSKHDEYLAALGARAHFTYSHRDSHFTRTLTHTRSHCSHKISNHTNCYYVLCTKKNNDCPTKMKMKMKMLCYSVTVTRYAGHTCTQNLNTQLLLNSFYILSCCACPSCIMHASCIVAKQRAHQSPGDAHSSYVRSTIATLSSGRPSSDLTKAVPLAFGSPRSPAR